MYPSFVLVDGTTIALPPHLFRRDDEADDANFYAVPRLVTHIDDEACAALTGYYCGVLSPGASVLDLMSSCVSHLPPNTADAEVVGVGMNHIELRENSQLTRYLVHNLNRDSILPFEDNSFDACTLAVSIQYLVRPVDVFREVGRVLKHGASMIVSYSNRLFPTKAVMIWKMLDNMNHGRLVAHYFEASECFDTAKIENISPNPGISDPLYVVVADCAINSPAV